MAYAVKSFGFSSCWSTHILVVLVFAPSWYHCPLRKIMEWNGVVVELWSDGHSHVAL